MSDEPEKIAVEEVNSVDQPRRARVDDVADQTGAGTPHKPDYLEGFLKEVPQGIAPGEPGGVLYEGVIAALREKGWSRKGLGIRAMKRTESSRSAVVS